MPIHFDELHELQFELLRAHTGRALETIADYLHPDIETFAQALPPEERPMYNLHICERLIDCFNRTRPQGLTFFQAVRRYREIPFYDRSDFVRSLVEASLVEASPGEASPGERSLAERSLAERSPGGTSATGDLDCSMLEGELLVVSTPETLAERYMCRRLGREDLPACLPYGDLIYLPDEERLDELREYLSAVETDGAITVCRILHDSLAGWLAASAVATSDGAAPVDDPARDVARRMVTTLDVVIDLLSTAGEVPDWSYFDLMQRLDTLDIHRQMRLARAVLRLREKSLRDAVLRPLSPSPLSGSLLDAWSPADWRELGRLVECFDEVRHRRLKGDVGDADVPTVLPAEKLVWRLRRTDLARLVEELVQKGYVEERGREVNDWLARSVAIREPDGSLLTVDAGKFASLRRHFRTPNSTARGGAIAPIITEFERELHKKE